MDLKRRITKLEQIVKQSNEIRTLEEFIRYVLECEQQGIPCTRPISPELQRMVNETLEYMKMKGLDVEEGQ